MLKVLMVEDDAALAATVKDCLFESLEGIDFQLVERFPEAMGVIEGMRPDVIILDWYQGDPATGEDAGAPIWTAVWERWFCPIVVYSAGDVQFPQPPPGDHPFIKSVAKGAGTARTVTEDVRGFLPHVAALRQAMDDLSQVTHAVLRHLAVPLFRMETDDARRIDILIRAARRRAAAMIDDATCFGGEMSYPWEQYIFPVLTSHCVSGDILRMTGGDPQDPASYRVILTPTCDMVRQRDGRWKVSDVLAGRCEGALSFLRKLSLPTGEAEARRRITPALNEPHMAGLVPVPECPGTFPLMCLNLRQLELIPLIDIGNGEEDRKAYVRVASLDSPFREHIVWAYLQIACRPGLPPRDTGALAAMLAGLWVAEASRGNG